MANCWLVFVITVTFYEKCTGVDRLNKLRLSKSVNTIVILNITRRFELFQCTDVVLICSCRDVQSKWTLQRELGRLSVRTLVFWDLAFHIQSTYLKNKSYILYKCTFNFFRRWLWTKSKHFIGLSVCFFLPTNLDLHKKLNKMHTWSHPNSRNMCLNFAGLV